VTASLPPDAHDEPATPAAFARWLRQERELRGLSREDVARTTRLAPGVVDGLESGDVARMPPRGYVYGYLRTYAGALGLDADDVVLRWQEVEAAEEAAQPPPPRGAPRAAIVAGVVAAALAALAVATWLLR
jgi:transcriptional regulator with XRE-family HTH domain